jgi:hypothetical protein
VIVMITSQQYLSSPYDRVDALIADAQAHRRAREARKKRRRAHHRQERIATP